MTQKALLLILDGFGVGKDSPFNAINNAKMPFYRSLIKKYPHSQLLTHGQAVGLPDGVMGNSEVGHMTMGAGRIIFQDLTRISKSIEDHSFFENKTLKETLQASLHSTKRVHLVGLISDGGVHSHIDHLKAILDFCLEMQVPKICVHAFLDGRDTPPTSGINYIKNLISHHAFSPAFSHNQSRCKIATISGRYYAMDRDKRWERLEKAYMALTGQVTPLPPHCTPLQAIEKSYANNITDEFVEPLLLEKDFAIQDEDSVLFFNFRSDRAREMTEALTAKEWKYFDRKHSPKLSAFAGMTVYDKKWTLPALFLPQNFDHLFAAWLEKKRLKQCRIAETEKYAHVTYFFNGGKEKPFASEDRVLIQSPKEVSTYDLKPEMSAYQVAEEAVKRLQSQDYDFMLINFANADMVGHTGNYEATVKAIETLDKCLEKVISNATTTGMHVLLTADHGNAEEMRDKNGAIHTQHTLNPVPAIWISPLSANAPKRQIKALKDGALHDIMPTLCTLMGLPIPNEVTGKSLL